MIGLLRALLEEELTEESRIHTFEETGVLRCDVGLIVRLPNGDEFQITVIKSQIGKEDE